MHSVPYLPSFEFSTCFRSFHFSNKKKGNQVFYQQIDKIQKSLSEQTSPNGEHPLCHSSQIRFLDIMPHNTTKKSLQTPFQGTPCSDYRF